MRHSLKICVSAALAMFGTSIVACEGDPSEKVSGTEAACTWERVDCGPNMFGVKLDDPVLTWISVYDLPGGYYIRAIRQENETVDWESNIGIDSVSVKGGPADMGKVFPYDPEKTSDTGLVAPINAATGMPYGVSNIVFCLDFELQVEKTAVPSFTRSWDWSIDKQVPITELTLSKDQTFKMPYDVVLTAKSVDSEFGVSGAISVTNPWPLPAKVNAIEDVVSGIGKIDVACAQTLPVVLNQGETIDCTYGADLPDALARTNTVTAVVDSSSEVKGASATVDVAFGAPTDIEDECVAVSDSRMGMLGELCAGQEDLWFTYSLDIGPYECGEDHRFENVASFVTKDTHATGADSALVTIDVPCPVGCTLTPGYWKTHSAYGPAPTDDTWTRLSAGPDTTFFASQMTYYQVLWTPPKRGNAYFILAHAYIAAKLNGLNLADTSAIENVFEEATHWLENTNPTSALCARDRARVLWLATKLDEYNNGMSGPSHCSE